VSEAPTNQKPRSRPARLAAWGVAVVAFFSCCGCPAYNGITPFNGLRMELLKADLKKRLPEGSTREQAEAWFASHGFEPHDLIDRDGRRTGRAATIPNSTLFEVSEIRVEMAFDDNGKLRWWLIVRNFNTL
jgi:hypothetical protein